MKDDFIQKNLIENYSYSLGTQSLLDAITSFNPKNDNHIWDTTIINIATILRNNLNKDRADSTVIQRTITDISAIITNIYHYLKNNHVGDSPYIVLYIPNYKKLHPLFRRTLSGNEERINKLLSVMSNDIQDKRHFDKTMFFDMPIYTCIAGNDLAMPYRSLFDKITEINGITSTIKRVMTRKYMLISHVALDYYLFRCFRNVRLFECFTGLIKEEKELGKKVFKEEGIPFNIFTHVLFGDTTKVKPLVSRNKKQEFIELAHKQRWMLKEDTGIRSSIVLHDQVLGALLSKVNF